jgi:predicted O-linked N-acetylglucosamine transferase (SPINDLY family)
MEIFRQRGIADDRVEFIPRMSIEEYFGAFGRIDVALDPFPVPGGTTTCDGMWMGVPVVTLAGDCAARRGGVSLMSLVGLGDLIATEMERYIEIAASLAGDPVRLAELRRTMRQRLRGSPVMNEQVFARDLERCYLDMWNRAP